MNMKLQDDYTPAALYAGFPATGRTWTCPGRTAKGAFRTICRPSSAEGAWFQQKATRSPK